MTPATVERSRPVAGRRTGLRRVGAGLGLAAVAAAAFAILRTTSAFAVDQITVRGVPSRTATEVRAATRQLVGGRSLLAIDAGLLARQLAALPAVHEVRVDRSFPHALVITVQPEVAVAVVSTNAGRFVLAASGRVLGPAARGSGGLPLLDDLRGVIPRPGGIARGASLDDQLAIASALRSSPAGRGVSAIGASADGLAAVIGHTTLRLGDTSDLGRKLGVAAAVLRAARHDAGAAPTYVDISVPDRPVSRSVGGDPVTIAGASASGQPPVAVDIRTAIQDLFFPGTA